MAKVAKSKRTGKGEPDLPNEVEAIKRLVVIAMFADVELMDQLVLKGGNAIDLVHRISTRASVDIDFSVSELKDGVERFKSRAERSLVATFDPEGYVVFDL